MAPRKNTKSTSTPAPVADSKIAKAYTGRKTRAMKAAEEKAAAEPGNTAAHADVEPVETADMPKPPKPNTLKSASNALKALKGAAKTNQNNDSTTMQASSSAAKPTTSTPAVSNAATTTPVVTAAAVSNTVITAPVATAAPPPSPEFHGVPPAGFDSGRSQREIDAGLTKFQAQQAKKAHLWGTQVKPVRPEDMASDFEAMGFGPEKVKELVAMKEPVQVDGLTQRCTKDGLCVPGTGPELPKRVRKPRGQGKYQNLVVFEDKDWVLFDHRKPYPTKHGAPPLSITRWARFVPGNARIIVMNMKSQSLRSQATPKSLSNKKVNYTDTGPKIEDWEPIPNPNKKAAAPATAPVAAPPLGRGARRNAARVVSSEALPPPPSRAPAPKRKADEISADEPPAASSAPPVAAAPTPAAATRKRKIAPVVAAPLPPPPPAVDPAPVAPPPAPVVSVAGVKRKRRAARPKKTPAKVDNSSSE